MSKKKQKDIKKEKAEDRSQQTEDRSKELEDILKRVQADYMNFRKRTEEERKNLLANASRDTILKVLPVLDNLERAFEHEPEELKDNEWVKGLSNIKAQFENILKAEGLEIIESKGKQFDHNLHEAISFVPGEGEDDEIIEEYEKGYILNGKVIRPAKVIVCKKAE